MIKRKGFYTTDFFVAFVVCFIAGIVFSALKLKGLGAVFYTLSAIAGIGHILGYR